MKQAYWRVIYTFTWFVIISGFIGTEQWRQRTKTLEEKVILTDWTDFLDLVPIGIAYFLIRKLYLILFEDSILKRLKISDPINFEIKASKVTKEGWHMIAYGFSTILAYALFGGTDLISVYLLGTSDCNRMVTSWTEVSVTPALRFFLMVALTHHFSALVVFVYRSFNTHVPEFNEFFLHHLITVAMIMLCYLCSFFPFGLTVLISCDISDFILSFSKFVRDIGIGKNHYLQEISFVFLVASWLYTRFFVMTFCVLSACGTATYMIFTDQLEFFNKPCQVFFKEKYAYYYQVKVFLIFLLCILNLYWTGLILRIAYNRVIKKDTNFAIQSHGEKLRKTIGARKD